MGYQGTEDFHKTLITGTNDAANPRSDRMGDIRTETGDVAKTSDRLAVHFCKMGFRTVFHHTELMLFRDFHDFLHFTGHPEGVDRHNAFRIRSNVLFNLARIYIISIRLHIDKNHL